MGHFASLLRKNFHYDHRKKKKICYFMNDLKISTEFRFGYFGKHQEKIREGFLKPGEPIGT